MTNRLYLIGFIMLIALALFLRTYNIGKFSIWYDEKVSLCIANGIMYTASLNDTIITQEQVHNKKNFPNVIKATINDNGNSIVYNVMLYAWTKSFGNKDWTIRFLSVIGSLLLIPLVYQFARDFLGSKRGALLTVIFISIHSLLVDYSHQARSYSWACLFSFLCSIFFIRLFFSDKAQNQSLLNYSAYVLFGTLSLLTHYLTAYIFISHAIIFWVYIRKRKLWFNFFLSGITVCFLFGIWLYLGGLQGYKLVNTQNQQYAQMAANYKPGDNTFVMPATLKNIGTGIFQVWLQLFGNKMQSMSIKIRELAPLLLIPFFVIGFSFWTNNNQVRKKIVILTILTFTQTIFATFLAVQSGHCISFQPLYAIFAVPYAMILLAYSFDLLPIFGNKLKLLSVSLFVIWIVIMIISNRPVLRDEVGEKESRVSNPYIKLAQSVNETYSTGDTLVLPSDKDIYMLNLYLDSDKQFAQKRDSTNGQKVYFIKAQKNDTLILADLTNIKY